MNDDDDSCDDRGLGDIGARGKAIDHTDCSPAVKSGAMVASSVLFSFPSLGMYLGHEQLEPGGFD